MANGQSGLKVFNTLLKLAISKFFIPIRTVAAARFAAIAAALEVLGCKDHVGPFEIEIAWAGGRVAVGTRGALGHVECIFLPILLVRTAVHLGSLPGLKWRSMLINQGD